MNSCIQLESSNRQGGKSKIFPKFFPNCLIPVPHFIFSHGLHNRGGGERVRKPQWFQVRRSMLKNMDNIILLFYKWENWVSKKLKSNAQGHRAVIKEAVKPAYFYLPLEPVLEDDTPGHGSIVMNFSHTQLPTHSKTFLSSWGVLLNINAKDGAFLALPLPYLDGESGTVT